MQGRSREGRGCLAVPLRRPGVFRGQKDPRCPEGPSELPAGMGEEKKEELRKAAAEASASASKGKDAKSKRDKRALGPLDLLRAPIHH